MAIQTLFYVMFLLTNQLDNQNAVTLLNKIPVEKGGDVRQIFVVTEKTLLIVDSGSEIYLWQFNDETKPIKTMSVRSANGFWKLSYSGPNRAFAHADSSLYNTGIFVYTFKKDGQIEKKTTLDFESKFKQGPTMDFDFSPSGSLFAYSSYNEKTIAVLETKTYKQVLALPYKPYVEELRFLNDKLILTISQEDQGTIWDISNLKATVVKQFRVPKEGYRIYDVHHDKNAEIMTLIYKTADYKLGICEISYQDKISINFRAEALPGVGSFSVWKLSPKKDYLIMGNLDANLKVVDWRTLKVVFSQILQDVRVIRSVAYIDDSRFVVGGIGERIYVFAHHR